MTAFQSSATGLLQECLGLQGTEAERVASVLSDLDRFRLETALRFLRRATSSFEVFFFMEALVAAKKADKCERMVRLFQRHASEEDKIEVAAGWAFNEPFRFGTEGTPVRHVMHGECVVDAAWLIGNGINPDGLLDPLGCMTGHTCECVQWLRQHPAFVDDAVGEVIRHLCDMRHSLVHESWPTLMITDDPSETGPQGPPESMSSTTLDAYPCDPDDPAIFRTYETSITFNRFKSIAVATARAYLTARPLPVEPVKEAKAETQGPRSPHEQRERALEACTSLNQIVLDLIIANRVLMDYESISKEGTRPHSAWKPIGEATTDLFRMCIFHEVLALSLFEELVHAYGDVIPRSLRVFARGIIGTMRVRKVKDFRHAAVAHLLD